MAFGDQVGEDVLAQLGEVLNQNLVTVPFCWQLYPAEPLLFFTKVEAELKNCVPPPPPKLPPNRALGATA